MPEYHPGTDIEIPDNVPMSYFRNAIQNTKRYMKHNNVSISDVCEAAYTGDLDLLEEMLATGDEKMLYNGDVNAHVSNITALMMASMAGQTECVELLIRAKADPHVKECMRHGQDPEDGRTALDFAKKAGYEDIAEILEQAQKDTPYGYYLPAGKTNNAKIYAVNAKPWKGINDKKGWYSSRPGAAELAGFDCNKYGTGKLPDGVEEDMFEETGGSNKTMAALTASPTIPVGILFPGQGSQYVKMLKQIMDMPAVKDLITRASAVVQYDILKLCLEGPEEKLEQTRYSQVALFVGCMAGMEKLKQERSEAATQFRVCAGLSLGEYTALCAAGVFSFEDGVKLVHLRGTAMQEAADVGSQFMLSVAGVERSALEDFCAQACKFEGAKAVCQISNELFPKGFSCGGTEKAINKLKELAEANGALQVKILKTRGAFHTRLMEPAKERLDKALDEVLPRMKPPRCAVYMNVTGKAVQPGTDPKEIVKLLKQQLVSKVLWDDSVRAMIKSGVTEFYEVGPMKQLRAMMKRIDQKVWNTTRNIEV